MQNDGEAGAFTNLCAHRNTATMLFGDDIVGDGQPQPRSFARRFGGEEGVEECFQMLVFDAHAVVGNVNFHALCCRARPDGQRCRGLGFL